MLQLTNPAWWYTLVTVVLGSLGVTETGLPVDVKTTVTGVVGLVVAVYTHEHHKTVRNADTASAAIAAARAAASSSPTSTSSAVVPVLPAPVTKAPASGSPVVPQSDHVSL